MVKGISESKCKKHPRIGLLGGTFDPVHNGHLAMAAAVRRALELDSFFFVPAARPPHKERGLITSFEKRRAMLDLALAGMPFEVCPIEKDFTGPSYTIDTLKALRQDYSGAELYFVIGQDSFIEIQTWKEFQLLPQLACLVVVNRPTAQITSTAHIMSRHFGQYRVDAAGCLWRLATQEQGGICFVTMPSVLTASRQIRECCSQGQDISQLIPASVLQYINENNLYRSDNGSDK